MGEERKAVLVRRGRNGWTCVMPNKHNEEGTVTSRGTIQGYGEKEYLKYCDPGTPVVDSRTIPRDKLFKWVMQSPMIDPDMKGFNETEVASYPEDILEHPQGDLIQMLPTGMQTFMLVANGRYVSVEQYVKLAETWGATVTYTE